MAVFNYYNSIAQHTSSPVNPIRTQDVVNQSVSSIAMHVAVCMFL